MTSPQTPKDVAHPQTQWRFDPEDNVVECGNGITITVYGADRETRTKIALRVAAVPEHEETVSTLLEALKAVEWEDSGLACIAQVRAAIAKASKERT